MNKILIFEIFFQKKQKNNQINLTTKQPDLKSAEEFSLGNHQNIAALCWQI